MIPRLLSWCRISSIHSLVHKGYRPTSDIWCSPRSLAQQALPSSTFSTPATGRMQTAHAKGTLRSAGRPSVDSWVGSFEPGFRVQTTHPAQSETAKVTFWLPPWSIFSALHLLIFRSFLAIENIFCGLPEMESTSDMVIGRKGSREQPTTILERPVLTP